MVLGKGHSGGLEWDWMKGLEEDLSKAFDNQVPRMARLGTEEGRQIDGSDGLRKGRRFSCRNG